MRVESVDYLLERFGVVLDVEAAFKAKSLVTAKVKARLEKVAVKEPEFAHVLAEVAERVLSSFGRLMASPDAARHVHEALFYLFEGYQTRDGEVLFARIERTVREAVRRAEEAGIPDAEYRIKQFVLEVIDILARAGERYRRDALKGLSTVEKALRATAFAGLSATALYSVYSGLYSEAVVSSVASAVALAEVGQFREAVQYVQKAAKALYESAREVFEQVRVSLQRLVELFVEAVTRMLAWVDEHRAYLFLMAAGAIALSAALNMWGLMELERLAYAASATSVAAGVKVDERRVAEAVRLAEGALGKTPTLAPGGGVLAEVERWVAGLRSGEVKTAVARLAEELEKWLGAVKGGRYADYSSGFSARICAEGVCAMKTRGWAFYFKPVRVEAGKAGEAKERWIVAKSPEEFEAWLSKAGSAYVAPALFFEGGGVELRVVAVSEAVVDEVKRRLVAVRGAGCVQHDALAASARRGVLTAAKVGDFARLWKAYVDGVESYLTDPAKREELRREAERWIKALRLDATAEEAVSRGLEMLKALRDSGLFDTLRAMAKRLGEAGVESDEKMLKALEGGEFWLEATPTGKTIKICGERCVTVKQRGIYTLALEVPSVEVQIPRLLPEEYVKRLHIGWLASDESRDPQGLTIMSTTQLWQLYAWLVTKSGRIRIHAADIVLKKKGISTELYAFSRDLRLVSGGSTLSVAESGRAIYQIPLEGRDIKVSTIKLVLKHLDAGDPLPLVAYYLGDGVARSDRLIISVSSKRMHLFEGRGDVSFHVKQKTVVFRLASELYARAVAELYLSGVGVLLDALHSHKWVAFKRLAAESLAGFRLAGQYVKLSSANGLHGWVSFKTREEAVRYAEAARRELEKLGIYATLKITSGIYHQVIFDEKTLRRLAKVDEAVKHAIERLEILSTPRPAAKPITATRLDVKPERLVKPKIETKHEELPKPVEPKAAAKREEMPRPKTTVPKAVDKIAFQLVDGSAAMRLKLTYVMKGGKKMPTVNAVARFSALEEAEEFRRRLRLSGINASVISKGASGFEVVVPKDELEKLTPEEKEAVKRYLEHVAQTEDEEKKKAAEEILRRFDFGAKAVNIGGIRLGLVRYERKSKGVRAEKYGDPQLIAEIKTALEKKLREILGDEYEQWKDHVKTTEEGRRLVITHQLLQRLTQNPNTTKLNEKT
jgi:DNA-directed RNA polymerase subunit F